MDLLDLAHRVPRLLGHDHGTRTQAITIARPRAQVAAFWHDPDNLDRILDGIAEIRPAGPDRCTWVFGAGTEAETRWETEVIDLDGGLSFLGSGDAVGEWRVRVSFADAPHGLGTEVTVRTRTPLPRPLTRAVVFTALYRARALLQTGETPESAPPASGRAGEER
ncbi:hypothetical protein [Nocardia asteroides]|uniref:hypothetical protein n=1 Tax=Nocardia asteroides TaxID=1824 RepID=UPI001E2CA9DE|nr:hypothetical protein [Nocardia asteroides]UGT55327.1 hypothetical protein LTT85_00145 [Nocardia asteroides]